MALHLRLPNRSAWFVEMAFEDFDRMGQHERHLCGVKGLGTDFLTSPWLFMWSTLS